MKTTIFYQVISDDHYVILKDGYSKYKDRLRLFFDGFIPYEEVYGIQQCIEHISEYYGRVDEYQQQRQKEILTIEKVTCIVEKVDYTPIPPIDNGRRPGVSVRYRDFLFNK